MAQTEAAPSSEMQELYDQAENLGGMSAEDQEVLASLATEAGTTIEALAAARAKRDSEAAARTADLLKTAHDDHLLADEDPETWKSRKEDL